MDEMPGTAGEYRVGGERSSSLTMVGSEKRLGAGDDLAAIVGCQFPIMTTLSNAGLALCAVRTRCRRCLKMTKESPRQHPRVSGLDFPASRCNGASSTEITKDRLEVRYRPELDRDKDTCVVR